MASRGSRHRRATSAAQALTPVAKQGQGRGVVQPVQADWRALGQISPIPGIAILPLRLFLGLTFIYAAIQKITDPGFFTSGSTTYIGTQMKNFAHGSPINFLLSPLVPHAEIIGALTIVGELAIGLLVFTGLLTRPAAIAGLILNGVFFLSASWNVYPYFLGADIVFVMCWLTLAITGPGGFALDAVVRPRLYQGLPPFVRRYGIGPIPEAPVAAFTVVGGPGADSATQRLPETSGVTRREVLAGGFATLVLVMLGVIPRTKLTAAASPVRAPNAATPPQPGSAAPSTSGAQSVGTLSQIPVNSALPITDPKTGDPAVVIHTTGSTVVAYDAVCTHAGCTVQYDPQQRLLICPCHGGAFDPAQGGQVVGGPPPAPLAQLPIKVDSQGSISLS